jgi:8-oxo-dGTP diphosphatase
MTGGARQRIDVVAGILRKADGRVLISERVGDAPFAGLWEFPGGKVRVGESALVALRRELEEEIGVVVEQGEHFLSVHHDYADRSVAIEFYIVEKWRNIPVGCDGQGLRWCFPQHIDVDELLAADEPVLNALRIKRAALPESTDTDAERDVVSGLNGAPIDR